MGKAKSVKRTAATPGFILGVDRPVTAGQARRTATPERLRHSPHTVESRDREDDGPPPTLGLRILDSCPLDAYLRRGMIDERQHDAGAWLARCFKRAVHQPSMIAIYGERLGGGGGSDPMMDGRNALWRVILAAGLAVTASTATSIKATAGAATARIDATLPAGRSAVLLTPAGRVALSVCGMEEWAGGTRNMGKLRAALDILAEHLASGRRAPTSARAHAKVGDAMSLER
ncbi:hypothetical protein [Azospirillum doebereinerae]